MDSVSLNNNWHQAKAEVFWGEIAPCEHVIQIYEHDDVFLDTLASFVGGGINAGECCIVIATHSHLTALENRLTSYGVHLETLLLDDRYIPINAEQLLFSFIVNGWPDKERFLESVAGLIERGRLHNRKIRAFGEMVALLWAQGFHGATIQLEHLWSKLCTQHPLSLFCAYPKSGFTEDVNASMTHICCAHSKMIDGSQKALTDVIYRDVIQSKAR